MTAAMPTMDDALVPSAIVASDPDGAAGAADDADDGELLDHDYDGIREYDNPLPSWWSITFGATIAFAFLYFAYYNIAGWGRSPGDNYNVALAGWQSIYKAGPSDFQKATERVYHSPQAASQLRVGILTQNPK